MQQGCADGQHSWSDLSIVLFDSDWLLLELKGGSHTTHHSAFSSTQIEILPAKRVHKSFKPGDL